MPVEGRFRRTLLLSGLAGLLVSGLATAIAAWLTTNGSLPVLLPYPALAWLLGIVLGGFSLAEIPLMVLTMRRLIVEREGNEGVVLGLNALYVFFAAVYGLPVLLLTGSLGWGLALCGLSAVRLAASLLLVHKPR